MMCVPRIPFPLLVAGLVGLLGTASGAAPLSGDLELVRDRPYGPHPRQKLDLIYSVASPRPLVIFLHGGAWAGGDKRDNPLHFLADKGYAVASVNYRLSGDAPFPAQIQDCKAAVRWLRANSGRYRLDGGRFTVWGFSAGGHLGALLGTTGNSSAFETGQNLDQSSAVQAVVSFYGPGNLALYGETPPGDPLTELLGGPLSQKGDAARHANPVTWADPGDPPVLLLHGDKDLTVPLSHAQELEGGLLSAGVTTELKVYPGAGHGFVGGTFFDAARKATEFLKRIWHPI